MTFDEVLTQVRDLLQREGRVSYRALKLRFNIAEDYLEGLKDELIYAKRVAVDEDGKVLVWTGQRITGETDKRINSKSEGETAKREPPAPSP
ncbi:MAG: FeoC-like transcriptional regulator [Candidatus Binatia bacterium]